MTVEIRVGDCREALRTLPAGAFHTCVTSPPYFHQRDCTLIETNPDYAALARERIGAESAWAMAAE